MKTGRAVVNAGLKQSVVRGSVGGGLVLLPFVLLSDTLKGAAALSGGLAIAWLIGRFRTTQAPAIKQISMPCQSSRTKSAFQPLASQEEIRRSDQAERERRLRTSLGLSALLSTGAEGRLRSRR